MGSRYVRLFPPHTVHHYSTWRTLRREARGHIPVSRHGDRFQIGDTPGGIRARRSWIDAHTHFMKVSATSPCVCLAPPPLWSLQSYFTCCILFIFCLACSSLSLPVYTERLHLRVICNTGCTPYSCKVSGLQTRRCPHWRSPLPSRLELFCVFHHEFCFGLDDRTIIYVFPRDLSLVVHQDVARFC